MVALVDGPTVERSKLELTGRLAEQWPIVEAWARGRSVDRHVFKALVALAASGERRAGPVGKLLGLTIYEVFAIRREFEATLGTSVSGAAYEVLAQLR